MFENLLRQPATKLKKVAICNFKTSLVISVIICLALGIAGIALLEEIGLVVGILVIVFGPIIACGRSYLNTLQILSKLEMMENVESIEDDTGHFRLAGMMTKPYSKEEAEEDMESVQGNSQSTTPPIVTKKSSYLEQFGV